MKFDNIYFISREEVLDKFPFKNEDMLSKYEIDSLPNIISSKSTKSVTLSIPFADIAPINYRE